jgi:hypothetical protein
LTDIRSALVNNNYFASLLTDAGLDTHILHSAPGVHRKVLAYLPPVQLRAGTRTGEAEEKTNRIFKCKQGAHLIETYSMQC